MADDAPLVRQWIMLRTLCARHYGVTVKELCREMNVSEKTIRRDLDTFQKAGFPLEEIVGDYGRKSWHVRPMPGTPELAFAFDEAIALYLSRHLMEPLAGTLFWDAVQRAFKKIRASLEPSALRYVGRFAGMFHQTSVGVSDYSKKAAIIDELMVGIEDHRAVFITYQSLSATEPVTYDIYPYGLIYHRNALYLVGWAPDHGEIRHWKINRMEDAQLTAVPFDPPRDFDLGEHLAHSFGVMQGDGQEHVVVRFAPRVARYVGESTWHASQQLTPNDDGSLTAAFDLDDTEEIKRWLLSFGRHVVVEQPESLKEEIRAEAAAIHAAYEELMPEEG